MRSLLGKVESATTTMKMAVRQAVASRGWPKRPQTLSFEITSVCDARCIHCPRQEMDRPVKPMAFPLFKRIVEQAAQLKVPELTPNGYGEILTVRRLATYLECISAQPHRFRVIINTNGHLMTEEKIELFLKHKVYSINITLDGATRETAEAVRVGLKMDRIEENIRVLLAMRKARGLKHPKLRVGMVLIPRNQHEMGMFVEKWKGVADYVGFAGASTRLGSVARVVDLILPRPRACLLPFRELNVWSGGKAVLCCQDWNEEHVVGDLNTQSLAEVWSGPALTEARRLHCQGRGGEIDICGRCNLWVSPSRTARLWH